MYDAIYLAVNQMRHADPRKGLLILSDGGDNDSRYSDGEVINLLREADVNSSRSASSDDAHFLKKAAAETGGALVAVHNLNDLSDAVDKLSTQVRSQYVLGYYPAQAPNNGKFHKVKVMLSQAVGGLKLRTSWRHGYFASY